jgi:hypothetical protein
VQPVPGPAGLTPSRGPRLAPAAVLFAVALIAAVTAIVLSLSESDEPPYEAQPAATLGAKPYNGLIGGVQLQSARCAQWNAGTAAERAKVVGALEYAVGGATQYGRGTTLPTGDAYALLDRTCANPIAENWLLYQLYIRAAGFRSSVAPGT